MPHTNDDDAAKQQRKKDFDAFLEKSAERREEMKQDLLDKAEQRQAEDTARAERQKAGAKEEEKKEEKQKEALAEWRKQEKERKKEVEEMKKRKEREMALLAEKQKVKEEEEKKHKEYMQNLEWAAAIDRLRRKRKQEAEETKLDLIHKAERTAKEHKDQIHREDMSRRSKAEKEGRSERGDIESHTLKKFKEIDDDINQRKAKLFAKQQTEASQMDLEWRRKRAVLKAIKDPSLLIRMRDEIERNEEQAKRKLQKKYQDLTTALEVERTKRIDETKLNMKHAQEESSAMERDKKTQSRHRAERERLETDIQLQHDMKNAEKRGQEVMGMSSEEVADFSKKRRDENKNSE